MLSLYYVPLLPGSFISLCHISSLSLTQSDASQYTEDFIVIVFFSCLKSWLATPVWQAQESDIECWCWSTSTNNLSQGETPLETTSFSTIQLVLATRWSKIFSQPLQIF